MNQASVKPVYRLTQKALHLDFPLLGLLFILVSFGLFVLYSASNANTSILFRQSFRLIMAGLIMLAFSFIPPHKYKLWTPWIYGTGLSLLIAVMLMGKIGKGAQRWLELGLFRFQPSEIMKLAVPMMTAWFFDRQGEASTLKSILIAVLIIFIPALLIAK
jgi:rod shape determining protein RodA